MRSALLLLLTVGLAACQKPKSFDDRFDATANEIQQRAANLDEQANQTQPDNGQRM